MSSTVKAAAISGVLLLIAVVAFVIFQKGDPIPPPLPQEPTELVEPAERAEDVPTEDQGEQFEPRPVPRDAVSVTVSVKDSSGTLVRSAKVTVRKASEGDRIGEIIWDSARVRKSGQYEFKLQPGAYVVRAQASGYSGQNKNLNVVQNKPAALEFKLERGFTIEGRIVDSNGRGVPNARVIALKNLGRPDAELEEQIILLVDLPEMTERVDAETVSGQDGSYQLDGLEQVWYTVRAVADGYSPGEEKQVYAPRKKVDIRLLEGSVVNGTVVSTEGQSVAGALVRAYREPSTKALFKVIMERSRPPVDQVETDGSGAFSFTTLGTGVYNFVVTAPGFQRGIEPTLAVRSGENDSVRISMKPGLTIIGEVRGPNDELVVGAKVRPQRIGGAEAGRPQIVSIQESLKDHSVPTDEGGTFVLDTLADGRYSLIVSHDDYQTLRRQDVKPGTNDLTLRLSFGGRIKGVVRDAATGSPIVGARLIASDVADLRKEDITQEDGSFLLRGVQTARRPVSISVQAEGYARVRKEVRAFADREVEQDFELSPTGLVSGSVVTSSGDPIPGAWIMVKKPQETGSVDYTVGNARTDSKGRFTISGVESGEGMWVRAKQGGYLEATSDQFTIEPGQGIELNPIVLKLGASVLGRVVDPDGAPIRDCAVSVLYEGDTEDRASMNPTSNTNAKGEFKLAGLDGGEIRLLVRPADLLPKIVPGLKVPEGQTLNNVIVEVEQGGSVAGRVVNGRGEPVAGARVAVRDFAQGGKELTDVTSRDGSFNIGKIVDKDTVELEVTHADFASYLNERIAVGTAGFEVKLQQLGRIVGTVVGESGAVVPAFSIQPQSPAANKDPRMRLKAKNFKDGSFEYSGVPRGVYTVQVRALNFAATSIENVTVSEGQVVDLGQVQLKQGGVISGQVVDASTGAALPGVRVQVTGGAARFVRASAGRRTAKSMQVSDSNGEFTFTNMKGGEATLRFSLSGYVPRNVKVDPNISTQARGIVVELDRGGEIHGTVVDAEGKGSQLMNVYLMGDEQTKNQSTRTDNRGRFKFAGVPPGKYRIRAHRFGRDGEKGQQSEMQLQMGVGEIREGVRLVLE